MGKLGVGNFSLNDMQPTVQGVGFSSGQSANLAGYSSLTPGPMSPGAFASPPSLTLPTTTPSSDQDISALGKITSLLPGIGQVGSVLLQGAGMWMQHNYLKEAQAEQNKWVRIQNAIAERERRRQWKWAEEEREYSRSLNFTKNLFEMMQAEKGFENDLLTMWRTGK